MELLKLNIQMFADGKVVIETDLNDNGFKKGLDKMQSRMMLQTTPAPKTDKIGAVHFPVPVLFFLYPRKALLFL